MSSVIKDLTAVETAASTSKANLLTTMEDKLAGIVDNINSISGKEYKDVSTVVGGVLATVESHLSADVRYAEGEVSKVMGEIKAKLGI